MKKISIFTIAGVILLLATSLFQYFSFNDGRLHVTFCNVGQGDAIFITTPTNKHILIDSGPDARVLGCLSNHMPFWDRTIDMVLLTHPHADHFMGIYHLLDRYTILSFDTEKLVNKSASFKELLGEIDKRKIPIRYLLKSDKFTIKGKDIQKDVVISIAGPSQEYLSKTSPNGLIGETKEFASVLSHVSYGAFDALFTGDSQAIGLVDGIDSLDRKANRLEVLQIPHHGSRFGLSEEIVEELHPAIAIASVGKNSYGHPAKVILDMFQKQHIPVLRTDRGSDVEIVTDGKEWEVN